MQVINDGVLDDENGEREIASEKISENFDDHSDESEQIMVPSGKFFKRDKISLDAACLSTCDLSSDSSFRSVQVELGSHSFVDLVVQPNVLHKTGTRSRDTSVERKGIAEIVPARLAGRRRRNGRFYSGATLGISSSAGDRRAHAEFTAGDRYR